MTIDELNNTWITAGQKVSDLNAKANRMLVDDNATEDDVKNVQKEIATAESKRDLAKNQLDAARAAEAVSDKKNKEPLNHEEKNLKQKFVRDFVDMVQGDPKIVNELKSDLDENGNGIGLTIPQDVQTTINLLKRQFNSLEQYVDVQKVGTKSGSRVMESLSDIKPMDNLDAEDALIPDSDEPSFHLVKYLIARYSDILTLTNTLLKDTAEDILAYLNQWIAKKSTITRNTKILSVLGTLPAAQKKAVTTIDDIKTIANVNLDPMIAATSIYITNQSGFDILDHVKDAEGRYALQPDPKQPTQKTLGGKPVVVISDKWLPKDGANFPLYIGDLKQAVKLWDREQMSLLSTNIGAGAFEHDQTKIRFIDRFDVTLWDQEAVVYATFSKIADMTPSAGTATTSASTK